MCALLLVCIQLLDCKSRDHHTHKEISEGEFVHNGELRIG